MTATRAGANRRPAARATRTERIPVAVLGATGSVGQRFVQLLATIPGSASTKSWPRSGAPARRTARPPTGGSTRCCPTTAAGLTGEAARRRARVAARLLRPRLLGRRRSGRRSTRTAAASSSRTRSNHRMDADVPLLIPEINADHLDAIEQPAANAAAARGYIVTNPNCSTIGLAMAIAPIERALRHRRSCTSRRCRRSPAPATPAWRRTRSSTTSSRTSAAARKRRSRPSRARSSAAGTATRFDRRADAASPRR